MVSEKWIIVLFALLADKLALNTQTCSDLENPANAIRSGSPNFSLQKFCIFH